MIFSPPPVYRGRKCGFPIIVDEINIDYDFEDEDDEYDF